MNIIKVGKFFLGENFLADCGPFLTRIERLALGARIHSDLYWVLSRENRSNFDRVLRELLAGDRLKGDSGFVLPGGKSVGGVRPTQDVPAEIVRGS